jgi:hypothetical protein
MKLVQGAACPEASYHAHIMPFIPTSSNRKRTNEIPANVKTTGYKRGIIDNVTTCLQVTERDWDSQGTDKAGLVANVGVMTSVR